MTGPIGTAAAFACLLTLAACGGGGGGGSSAGPGGNGGNGDPPGPVTVIGGTVIDLTNPSATNTPSAREAWYNARERAALLAEPGSINVLALAGDGGPYDTFAFWEIDGTTVTTKRAGLTLAETTQSGRTVPGGYSFKNWRVGWLMDELNHLGIRYPVPEGDDPKPIGSEIVEAFTDKADAADTDYLEFGWWRLIDFETDSATGTRQLTARFGTYARATNSTTTDLSGITGTASYSGNAIGYANKSGTGGFTGIFVDGTVALSANFDTSMISGSITNLRKGFISEPVIDDTWVITLAATAFDDRGVIARGDTTTQDASAEGGHWTGEFQLEEDSSGNAIQPPALAGQFTAQFDDGGVTGVFGAKKQ